jgi:hypothetical protein
MSKYRITVDKKNQSYSKKEIYKFIEAWQTYNRLFNKPIYDIKYENGKFFEPLTGEIIARKF